MKKCPILILVLFCCLNQTFSQKSDKLICTYSGGPKIIEFYEDSTFKSSIIGLHNSTIFGKYKTINNCGFLLFPLVEKPYLIHNCQLISFYQNIDTNFYYFNISSPTLKKLNEKIVYKFEIVYTPCKSKNKIEILNSLNYNTSTIKMKVRNLVEKIDTFYIDNQISYYPDCKIQKNENIESIAINLSIYYDMKDLIFYNEIEKITNNMKLIIPDLNDEYIEWFEKNFFNYSFIQIIDENSINWNGAILTKNFY